MIEFDFSNVHADAVGEAHGLTEADLAAEAARSGGACARLQEARKAGRLPFLDLPYQDALVERIRKRSRDYESDISEKYLEDLIQAYNYFFYHYKETPLLVINTTDIDFVENESDLEDLVAQIGNMGKGVQYYMPMSKR